MKVVLFSIIIVAVGGVTLWFAVGRETANAPAPADTAIKEQPMQNMRITSSAFAHNTMMPERFTCDGEDVVPPLEIGGIPAETKTLALIMHDPDAPRAGGWTHWVRFNVPWTMYHGLWKIEEGKEPEGIAGRGTGGEFAYQGPCPPSGTHRYFFTAYALDTELAQKEGATKAELESAMEGHIIATGELIGRYSRNH